MQGTPDVFDVIVVGAGFTGLRAATLLADAGLDVVVIEARDRVGGKVESQPDALGTPVDTGGQFVCDDMPVVLDLIRSQGKRLVEVADPRPGFAFTGDVTEVDPVELDRAFDAGWGVWEALGADPPPDFAPRETADAWFARHIDDPVVLRAVRGAVGGLMCMTLDRISAANMAFEARRTPLTVEELQYVVPETLHQVAVDLAATLPRPVRLGSTVGRVRRDGALTTIECSTPEGPVELRARHALLAIPPAAIPHVTFEPPLPDRLAAVAAGYGAGDVFKYLIRYDRPFWRRDDVSSLRRFLEPPGVHIREASPAPDRPTLVVFLGGAGALAFQRLTAAERRDRMLGLLVTAYGADAASPVSFLERDWRPDRLGAGGYCNELLDLALAEPDADALGVLRAGAPGVTFASTELASAFPGYVEGALRAGAEAAATVQSRLA